jgi:hypothetical protein
MALIMEGLGEEGALGGPLVRKARMYQDLHFYKA